MSCNQGLVKVWYRVDFMMDHLAMHAFDLSCPPKYIGLDMRSGKLDVDPCPVHHSGDGYTTFMGPGDRFQVSACLMFDPSFEVQ